MHSSENINPVLVELHRGDAVESRHRGCAVAVNIHDDTVYQLGDTESLIYPRSALKLCISIPLIETGAADHFNLTDGEIALTCGSHDGAKMHTRAVMELLNKINCSEDDLENGADFPLGKSAAKELIARGQCPTRTHQNCSGKHSGLLGLSKFMNWQTRGYSDYQHPAQRAWLQTLSELLNADMFAAKWTRDGCGIPAICITTTQLARAFAAYATAIGSGVNDARANAMRRIYNAITKHPQMLAGEARCCTAVNLATAGKVLVKVGAEGVYGGVVPHLGLGFALKIEDGATRACEVALGALLNKLGALNAAQNEKLTAYFAPQILNSQKWQTGEIVPAEIWNE